MTLGIALAAAFVLGLLVAPMAADARRGRGRSS